MAKKNKLDNSNLSSKKLASEKKDSGAPGGGRGRKDEVGRSGVYPFSSPRAPKQAEVRAAGSWSQGQRGAASYEDHGGSELTYEGGRLLGALKRAAETWRPTRKLVPSRYRLKSGSRSSMASAASMKAG